MTKKTNQIGLETRHTQALADGLNGLLANYQLFYMNAPTQ